MGGLFEGREAPEALNRTRVAIVIDTRSGGGGGEGGDSGGEDGGEGGEEGCKSVCFQS